MSFLKGESTRHFDCLTMSTERNPIEYVWNALERVVTGRGPLPRDLQDLKSTLLDEWYFLPQASLNHHINHMRIHCTTCIIGQEGYIPY